MSYMDTIPGNNQGIQQLRPPQEVEVVSHEGEFRTEADFSLVNRLMERPRYKIPAAIRDKIIMKAGDIIDDPSLKPSTQLAAMKTILMADKHNIDLVKIAMPKKVENVDYKKLPDHELKQEIQRLARDVGLFETGAKDQGAIPGPSDHE